MIRKTLTVHTTVIGEDISADVEYTDEDDAEIVQVHMPCNSQLLRLEVWRELDRVVCAAVPDAIAEQRAEARVDREMEESIMRRNTALMHATEEAME